MSQQPSSFIIRPNILEIMRDYVSNYSVEICANLKVLDNHLDLHNIIKGEMQQYDGETRGVCAHKEYSKHIFHTHPKSLYAYPSVEDVIKLIKNYTIIRNSFIATKWGLWVLSNTERSNIYSTSCRHIIYDVLKIRLDYIGNYTKNKEGGDKSRELIEKDYLIIKRVCKDIENAIGVRMHLYDWKDILNTGVSV
jgi:hypothetical protein